MPIATAPREPGVPINTEIGVVGWAQELWKAPPPFLQRGADYVPELSREGGWRRMVETDVMGWAFLMPMDIVHPTTWDGPVIPADAADGENADALLAAMDEDDDALLKALTDAPTFGKLDVIDAKIILELIKTHAQGERL